VVVHLNKVFKDMHNSFQKLTEQNKKENAVGHWINTT